MAYVESPDIYDGDKPSIFLAGGITDCPNWQSAISKYLSDNTDLVIFNPKRYYFDTDNKTVEEAQIKWEHEYLRKATIILFWFTEETLCPIALYELGACSMTDKPLFIGVHPRYKRIRDVEIQTKLSRPDIKIYYSLFPMARDIAEKYGRGKI